MQNLLVEERDAQKESTQEATAISPWGGSGPILLLLAFAVFLFKTAPSYWPLTLTAFLGFGLIRLLEKRGLLLSLVALCAVTIFAGLALFWTSLLSVSIAVSWILIYLGDQEAQSLAALEKEKRGELEHKSAILERQLSLAKNSQEEQRKESAAHIDHLNTAYTQAEEKLSSLKHSLASLEKEYKRGEDQCALLTQKLESYRGQETLLQNAQAQIVLLNNQIAALSLPSIEEIERRSEEDPADFILWEHKYVALREQFEEKSQVLDETRKNLFRVENELLCLQKLWEEAYREPSEEASAFSRDLHRLEQQRQEMEGEIVQLEDLIASLIASSKPALPKRRVGKKSQVSLQKTLF